MKLKEHQDIMKMSNIMMMFGSSNLQTIYENTVGLFTNNEKYENTYSYLGLLDEQYDLFFQIGQNNYEYVVQKYNEVWDHYKKQYFFAKALCYADMRIIRFLEQKYNVKNNFTENQNFFKEILKYNEHVDVIKYAIDELKMNLDYCDKEQTYLDIACEFNCLNVVKYLIEERKMDPNYQNSLGNNCFIRAIMTDNQKVIEYLSNQMDIVYAIKKICEFEDHGWLGVNTIFQIQRFSKMIFTFKENYFAVNYLIEFIINKYKCCFGQLYLEKINPLMLQRNLLPRLRIRDPFMLHYTTFKKLVDSLTSIVII